MARTPPQRIDSAVVIQDSPGSEGRQEGKGSESQGEDLETVQRRRDSPTMRARASSIAKCGEGLERQVDKEKRKRSGDSPGEAKSTNKGVLKKYRGNTGEKWESQYIRGSGGRDLTREFGKIKDLMELLVGMSEEIRDLRRLVSENQNTKVEIKKSTAILEDMAAQIDAEEYLGVLGEVAETGIRLAEKTNSREKGKGKETQLVEASTQTNKEPWRIRNERTAEGIKSRIAKCDDLAEIMEVTSLDWPKETYKVTRKVSGNPIWENNEKDLALIITGEGGLDEPMGKQMCKRFPDVTEVPSTEKVFTVSYEAKLEDRREDTYRCRRTVTLVNIGVGEEAAFQALVNWKRKLTELGINRVAVPATEAVGENIRKLIECVLWDAGTTIILYENNRKGQNKGKASSENELPPNRKAGDRPRETTGAVLVKAQGRSYADLLRMVKDKVKVDTLGVKVNGVRKTRDGELLIEVDKEQRNVEHLQNAINECFAEDESITIRTGRRNNMTFLVRGVDVTTVGEIEETLRDRINGKAGEIKVIANRTGPDGNTVVTVSAPREAGLKLLELRKVRIGWSSCNIVTRNIAKRCLRCWGTGHLAVNCKGVDRSKMCLKCGETDHKVQECRNPPYCPICNKEGHRADSRACPALRGEVQGTNGQTQIPEGREHAKAQGRGDVEPPLIQGEQTPNKTKE